MNVFLPRHLSVSSVALYTRCPAQWKLRYVDRLATPTSAAQATGIAFHKALEAEHLGHDSERAWIAAANGIEASLAASGQTMTMTKLDGLTLLNVYRDRGFGGMRGHPERKFVLPFPSRSIPVPLLGFIDLVIPDEREYWDWKTTGGSYWTQAKVDLEPQKEAYGWAYQQLHRHRAQRARWIIFNTRKMTVESYETVPSPDGFRLFEMQAEATWQGIVEQRYDGCGECPELCKPPADKPSNGPSFDWEEATP